MNMTKGERLVSYLNHKYGSVAIMRHCDEYVAAMSDEEFNEAVGS